MIKFGPAGNSNSFYEMGCKNTEEAPAYLQQRGLTAFEYQCGMGVRVSEKTAGRLAEEAAKHEIEISLHAPYYISLSGTVKEKRLASLEYILQSARAVTAMGGNRIVIHPGGASKMTRGAAVELARDTLGLAWSALDDAGLGHVRICLETMGRPNQLGTLEEVVELCRMDERIIPCIDFGHLNTRSFGGLKTFEDYRHIFDHMEDKLGTDRMRSFHSHFSKIEYTVPGGEKRHLTFDDTVFGPDFEPVAELTVRKGCHPIFICESAGTQAEDAISMKAIYEELLTKISG